MTPEIIATIAQVLATLFMGIGLFCAAWQIKLLIDTHRDNHDWNRRSSTQQAIENLRALSSNAIILNKVFNNTDSIDPIPLEKINAAIEKDKKIKNKIHQTLNSYEALARGIYQGIYDEEIVKDARRGPMIQQYEAFSPYIKDRRKDIHKKAWCRLEAIVNKWKNELTKEDERAKTGLNEQTKS